MKCILLSACLMALTGALPVRAQDSTPATNSGSDSRPSFESFQIIERNNIFNPYRTPPRGPRGKPPPRIYTFTLNGTMTYQNQGYAFFGGNGVERGGVFGPAETINGYKIAEITNNTVKLTAASNQFVIMKVGMQMRREEKGPWKLITASVAPDMPPTTFGDASTASSDSTADSSSGDNPASPAALDASTGPHADVLKRLMARRAAEEGGGTNSATSNGDSNQ